MSFFWFALILKKFPRFFCFIALLFVSINQHNLTLKLLSEKKIRFFNSFTAQAAARLVAPQHLRRARAPPPPVTYSS